MAERFPIPYGLQDSKQHCRMQVVAENRHAIARINARAYQIRHVGRHVSIYENYPVIVDDRLDQFGNQLPDKNGIRGAAQPGHSVIVTGQRRLPQTPT
jgi:hypothetical protein